MKEGDCPCLGTKCQCIQSSHHARTALIGMKAVILSAKHISLTGQKRIRSGKREASVLRSDGSRGMGIIKPVRVTLGKMVRYGTLTGEIINGVIGKTARWFS